MHVTTFTTKKHFGAAFWETFPSMNNKPVVAARLWGDMSEGKLLPETLTVSWMRSGEYTADEALRMADLLSRAGSSLALLQDGYSIDAVFTSQVKTTTEEITDETN